MGKQGKVGEGASKGTQTEDSWAQTMGRSFGSGGDGVGVSNGEKDRTTVTEQQ